MAAMARGPYRPGIKRRRSIIERAVETFGANGFHGGTMSDVANRVGVTAAALSRYFSSKEDLLIAVMDYALDDWRSYVDSWEGANRRGLAYLRGLPRLVEYFERRPGIAQLFMTMTLEATSPDHPAFEYVVTQNRNTHVSFKKHLLEAVEDGEVPPFSQDQIADELSQIILMMKGCQTVIAAAPTPPITPSDHSGPVSRQFRFFIEATIARWQTMLLYGHRVQLGLHPNGRSSHATPPAR